jgi:hypothetical protein
LSSVSTACFASELSMAYSFEDSIGLTHRRGETRESLSASAETTIEPL